jgi:hypothetical protein
MGQLQGLKPSTFQALWVKWIFTTCTPPPPAPRGAHPGVVEKLHPAPQVQALGQVDELQGVARHKLTRVKAKA